MFGCGDDCLDGVRLVLFYYFEGNLILIALKRSVLRWKGVWVW